MRHSMDVRQLLILAIALLAGVVAATTTFAVHQKCGNGVEEMMQYCQDAGGYLATMENWENFAMAVETVGLQTTKDYAIGAAVKSIPQFVWTDGPATDTLFEDTCGDWTCPWVATPSAGEFYVYLYYHSISSSWTLRARSTVPAGPCLCAFTRGYRFPSMTYFRPLMISELPDYQKAETACKHRGGVGIAAFRAQDYVESLWFIEGLPQLESYPIVGAERSNTDWFWRGTYDDLDNDRFYTAGGCQSGFVCPWVRDAPSGTTSRNMGAIAWKETMFGMMDVELSGSVKQNGALCAYTTKQAFSGANYRVLQDENLPSVSLSSRQGSFTQWIDVCNAMQGWPATITSQAIWDQIMELDGLSIDPNNAYRRRYFVGAMKTSGVEFMWKYGTAATDGPKFTKPNGDCVNNSLPGCPFTANSGRSMLAIEYVSSGNQYDRSFKYVDRTDTDLGDGVVCELPNVTAPGTLPKTEYAVFNTPGEKRDGASTFCELKGGWLATFPDADSWKRGRAAITSHEPTPSGSVWIGGNCEATADVWVWGHGPVKDTVNGALAFRSVSNEAMSCLGFCDFNGRKVPSGSTGLHCLIASFSNSWTWDRTGCGDSFSWTLCEFPPLTPSNSKSRTDPPSKTSSRTVSATPTITTSRSPTRSVNASPTPSHAATATNHELKKRTATFSSNSATVSHASTLSITATLVITTTATSPLASSRTPTLTLPPTPSVTVSPSLVEKVPSRTVTMRNRNTETPTFPLSSTRSVPPSPSMELPKTISTAPARSTTVSLAPPCPARDWEGARFSTAEPIEVGAGFVRGGMIVEYSVSRSGLILPITWSSGIPDGRTVAISNVQFAVGQVGGRPNPLGFSSLPPGLIANATLRGLANSVHVSFTMSPFSSYSIDVDETVTVSAPLSEILPCAANTPEGTMGVPLVVIQVTAPEDEEVDTTRELQTSSTSVALASGAFSSGTTVTDQQALAVIGLMRCAEPYERKMLRNSRLLSPASLNDTFTGFVWGGIILIIGFTALHAGLLVGMVYGMKKDPSEACATLRFPALSYNVASMSFQGLSFAGGQLMVTSQGGWEIFTGIVGFFGSLLIPGFLVHVLFRRLDVSYVKYDFEQSPFLERNKWIPKPLVWFVFAVGRWQPPEVCNKYRGTMTAFGRPERLWATLPYWTPMLMTLGSMGVSTSTGSCVTQLSLMSTAQLLISSIILVFRPFRSRMLNVLGFLSSFSLGLALSGATALLRDSRDAHGKRLLLFAVQLQVGVSLLRMGIAFLTFVLDRFCLTDTAKEIAFVWRPVVADVGAMGFSGMLNSVISIRTKAGEEVPVGEQSTVGAFVEPLLVDRSAMVYEEAGDEDDEDDGQQVESEHVVGNREELSEFFSVAGHDGDKMEAPPANAHGLDPLDAVGYDNDGGDGGDAADLDQLLFAPVEESEDSRNGAPSTNAASSIPRNSSTSFGNHSVSFAGSFGSNGQPYRTAEASVLFSDIHRSLNTALADLETLQSMPLALDGPTPPPAATAISPGAPASLPSAPTPLFKDPSTPVPAHKVVNDANRDPTLDIL